MNNKLTTGAIEAIYNETGAEASKAPILQLINTKPLPQSGATRYRVLFSDGVYILQGILGTKLNTLVESGALQKYCFVRLTTYQVKAVQGKKLILAVELEILDNFGPLEKLGEPTTIDPESAGAAQKAGNGAAPQQQQQQHYNPYQQQQHQQQQHQPMQQMASPTGGPVFPISALNPYQNKWTIMARVTQKSDIKTWSKGSNEGKLFSMNMQDQSSEIKVTAFTQQVDDFYNMIEEGKVYYLSNAKVDSAKKQFSNLKNEYEIILQRDSQIIPAPDSAAVPKIRYDFVDLASLANKNEKDYVDVVAVVKDVDECTSNFSQKTNRTVIKRDLSLVDQTGFVTRLTLWGTQAESFTINSQNPVIAFKGVSVSNYGGKSLNAFGGSTYKINPEIDEVYRLRAWFDQQGHDANFQAHTSEFKGGPTPRMTFAEFKDAAAALEPQAQLYFETKGTIVMMSKPEHTFNYPACPKQGCNKKMTGEGNDWRCEKCNMSYPEPDYRYILSVNGADHTGHNWLSAFNEAGQIITSRPAKDLALDSTLIKPTFEQATFKSYILKCRAKQEIFGDEAKTRITIVAAHPVDWAAESKHLLSQIAKYGA